MNRQSKLKRGFGLALAALCTTLAPAVRADVVLGEKTAIDGGWTRTITSGDAGTEVVVAYTNTATDGFGFTVPEGVTGLQYLIVAGGGAGGSGVGGGGGGAGGVLTNATESCLAVTPGTALTVKVGKGGSVIQTTTSSTAEAKRKGANSSLIGGDISLEAIGGGGGGTANGKGYAGGSGGGGGGGGGGGTKTGGAGTEGQGYNGGTVANGLCPAGGGGAGGAAANTTLGYGNITPNGYGGDGIVCDITGESEGYAAGGGGGGESATTAAHGGYANNVEIGGAGGGGGGKKFGAVAGLDGTGSGGGGSGTWESSSYKAAKGGSGIVVLRYTAMVKATFTYEASQCAVTLNGTAVDSETKVAYVASNSVATVTVTPSSVYEYTTTPEGWTLTEGVISRTYTSSETAAAMNIEVPAPTKKAVESVTLSFTEAVHATKVATVGGLEVGAEVVKDSTVVVTATPETHYEYAEVPAGWEAASGAITYTFTASENTHVTIPEPTLIMVAVTVTGLANTSYVITTNKVEIASGTFVPEGTEFVVTVTPQGVYEYTAAPEGWTKNSDGTITYTATTMKDMAAIAVPSENFGKQQVTLAITSAGVAYVASNVTDKLEVKSGDKVNIDASIEVRATAYPTYVFTAVPAAGWTLNEGVMTGTFIAGDVAGAIAIPTATWTPTDGELIENGGFEYFNPNEFVSAKGFPASFEGSWSGFLNVGYYSTTKSYGIWTTGTKFCETGDHQFAGSPYAGSYAGALGGYKDTGGWLMSAFTTPSNSTSATTYKLEFYARKAFNHDATTLQVDVVTKAYYTSVVEFESSTLPTATDWIHHTYTFNGLAKNTEYRLRFRNGGAYDRYIVIDNVSLKRVKRGFIVIVK